MSIEEILLTKYDLEEKLDESLRHETLFNIRLWNHQKENEDDIPIGHDLQQGVFMVEGESHIFCFACLFL